MTKLPDHGDARRIAAFLESHPGWSAFWDKRDGVWRVAEDDPSSAAVRGKRERRDGDRLHGHALPAGRTA